MAKKTEAVAANLHTSNKVLNVDYNAPLPPDPTPSSRVITPATETTRGMGCKLPK